MIGLDREFTGATAAEAFAAAHRAGCSVWRLRREASAVVVTARRDYSRKATDEVFHGEGGWMG